MVFLQQHLLFIFIIYLAESLVKFNFEQYDNTFTIILSKK